MESYKNGEAGSPPYGGLPYLQPHLKLMPVDDVREPVAPDGVIPLEVSPVHMPKLGASDSRIFYPYSPDVFQGKGFPGCPDQNL